MAQVLCVKLRMSPSCGTVEQLHVSCQHFFLSLFPHAIPLISQPALICLPGQHTEHTVSPPVLSSSKYLECGQTSEAALSDSFPTVLRAHQKPKHILKSSPKPFSLKVTILVVQQTASVYNFQLHLGNRTSRRLASLYLVLPRAKLSPAAKIYDPFKLLLACGIMWSEVWVVP